MPPITTPTTTPPPTTTPAQAAKTITWRIQVHVPKEYPLYAGLEELCNRITQSSGGRLELKPSAAGGLVPAMKEFDAVTGGVIEGGMGPAYYWKDKLPAAPLFSYQVGGLSSAETMLWWNTGGGKLAQRMVDNYDVIVFQGIVTPPAIFLQSVRPVNLLTDYKDLKIAVSGDSAAILARIITSAAPVSIAIGELKDRIQNKTIEAYSIGGPAMHQISATQDTTKYIYLSSVLQQVDCNLIFFKKSAFDALPADLKGVVQAEMEALTPRFYSILWQKDVEALAKFRLSNTYVRNVTDDIERVMVKDAEAYYQEMSAKDPFYAEVYKSITTLKTTYRETWPNFKASSL